LYRALNRDKWRHDYRDVPEKELKEFIAKCGFDLNIFEEGYTVRALAIFEDKYKISINIYDIGKNGPEETNQTYCSIYDVNSNVDKVDLGIIRNEKGDVHFVIVKNLGLIYTKAYDKNDGHVKMCRGCGQLCKTTEQLLKYYKGRP
jgi:metal-sulfur cluster biosynthetic enzyme